MCAYGGHYLAAASLVSPDSLRSGGRASRDQVRARRRSVHRVPGRRRRSVRPGVPARLGQSPRGPVGRAEVGALPEQARVVQSLDPVQPTRHGRVRSRADQRVAHCRAMDGRPANRAGRRRSRATGPVRRRSRRRHQHAVRRHLSKSGFALSHCSTPQLGEPRCRAGCWPKTGETVRSCSGSRPRMRPTSASGTSSVAFSVSPRVRGWLRQCRGCCSASTYAMPCRRSRRPRSSCIARVPRSTGRARPIPRRPHRRRRIQGVPRIRPCLLGERGRPRPPR